ncbi:arsenate reductase-like glutaredoxin family protein [Bradyrhizobium japonicum USDA 38]|nr:arsenate reductase-like glutaredoxin family protein [Bradyrhizobium japonicum USDA 38]MCS3945969.1 arsenate reductase-like glutaredoxin family protein [Bradyrhizobium japonicum]
MQSGKERQIIVMMQTTMAKIEKRWRTYAAVNAAYARSPTIDSSEAMIARPILIDRSIVVSSKGVRRCRPSEAVAGLLDYPVGRFVKKDGEVVEGL